MKASIQQVSGILGLCVSCWRALTTCEFCSVSFKKLSLSNWPEREVQHSLCVHSFSFFFFGLILSDILTFSRYFVKGEVCSKTVDLWWTCTKWCVCIQTQNWARLPWHCILKRKNVSLLQSLLLSTRSSRKDIQPIWASAGWELNCFFFFEGWIWTTEFGPGVLGFGIMQLCFWSQVLF